MGERLVFQPLTREDKITVVIYRSGIVLSAVMVSGLAYLAARPQGDPVGGTADILSYGLQAAVGMSALFIHLYLSVFKKYLRNLYVVSTVCFAVLLFLGKGSPIAALAQAPARAILLLPLAGCLGFVTAKEAFCFRLLEGYLLAMVMPLYLLLAAGGLLSGRTLVAGAVSIAALLAFFTLRKAFMPLSYDIGDKSAYR